jgi:hypothetical protein
LVLDVVEFTSNADDVVVRNDKENAPELFALDCGQLPFERMSDVHFELLVADVFRAQIDENSTNWYDTVSRLNDGADQGRDVILFNDGKPAGVIQCKRLQKILYLDDLIYEICKFFLYAHIRPQIAPQIGTEFRYYLAVADRVSTEVFEFMQGAGRERFHALRAKFEGKCVVVRTKSKTLKMHSKLKDLSSAELCNIVWIWIDNLKTTVLKKDSLSTMVAKYPIVKTTYFKLDSDTTTIISEISRLLTSQGGMLSKDDEVHLSRIRTEYIDRTIGHGDRLNLGLIQGSDLLPFLKDMLAPKVGTLAKHFGSRSVVLTAGALAASPEQWNEINEIVKAFPYPLVFMVGCGEVSGTLLTQWRVADEMSWIEPTWEPATAQKFKAGWCWITDPVEEDFNCYVLVENEPEQQGFDCGNFSLRLAFKDVILWPTLGNDLTNSILNANSQLRRIIAGQADDKLRRPNLILASQHVDHLQRFVKSVGDYHAQRRLSLIAIAAANSQRMQACNMQPYSATGVFPAADTGHNTRASPPLMQPPSRVMRRSTSGGLTMTLKWDVNITLERATGHRLLDGVVQEDLVPAALEFHELFKRYPPQADCLEAVKNELESFNTFIQAGSLKDSQEFSYQTRHGVTAGHEFTLEGLASSGKYVMKAVQALSYLKSHENATWITEPGVKGHIQFSDPNEGDYNVLAWANDGYGVRQMGCELHRWAMEAVNHPGLVVFAHCLGRVRDDKPSRARYDITAAPTVKGSFTDVEMVNRVYFFGLDEIELMYDEADAMSAEEFMNEISTRRKKLDAQ